MDNFKKSDLKNGMYVETRNGNRYIKIDDRLLRVGGFMSLSSFDDDLKCNMGHKDLDIIKVFDEDDVIDFNNDSNLIWERYTKYTINIGDIFVDEIDGEKLLVYAIDNNEPFPYKAITINQYDGRLDICNDEYTESMILDNYKFVNSRLSYVSSLLDITEDIYNE